MKILLASAAAVTARAADLETAARTGTLKQLALYGGDPKTQNDPQVQLLLKFAGVPDTDHPVDLQSAKLPLTQLTYKGLGWIYEEQSKLSVLTYGDLRAMVELKPSDFLPSTGCIVRETAVSPSQSDECPSTEERGKMSGPPSQWSGAAQHWAPKAGLFTSDLVKAFIGKLTEDPAAQHILDAFLRGAKPLA